MTSPKLDPSYETEVLGSNSKLTLSRSLPQLKSVKRVWWFTTTPTSFQKDLKSSRSPLLGRNLLRIESWTFARSSEEEDIWSMPAMYSS